MLTQRFDAEYGRSSGGVINVVTKSGTNETRGSWFTLLRDDAMNAQTFTERINDASKQGYGRYQFGGSFGGPVVAEPRALLRRVRAQPPGHAAGRQYAWCASRPGDGHLHVHVPAASLQRQGERHARLAISTWRSVTRAITTRSRAASGRTIAHSAWATSTNSFDSLNVNHNWVDGLVAAERSCLQYSDFANETSGEHHRAVDPAAKPGAAAAPTAPQTTEQSNGSSANDYSWTRPPALARARVPGRRELDSRTTARSLPGRSTNGRYSSCAPTASTVRWSTAGVGCIGGNVRSRTSRSSTMASTSRTTGG